MTEAEIEKQAEEYASKITDELTNKGFLTTGEISQRYAGIVQGAKWGMEHSIEWHDLRKDPNDLPKESGYYWCRTEDNDKFRKHCPCLFTKTDGIFTVDVIAWCELPQFKE